MGAELPNRYKKRQAAELRASEQPDHTREMFLVSRKNKQPKTGSTACRLLHIRKPGRSKEKQNSSSPPTPQEKMKGAAARI